jgi:major membrane immunogen (membrane-anchored lipoprotein)
MKKIAYLFVIAILLISCNNSNNKSSNERSSDYYEESSDYDEYEQEEEEYYEDDEGIEDGTYSATVDYYNPETGYSATYTLDVEVEDNQVTIIYFPNDGYLDDDHIWPDELDEDGFVSIEGEEGKTYDVQIDY